MCAEGSDKRESHGSFSRAGNCRGTLVCGFGVNRKAFICFSEVAQGEMLMKCYCCNASDVKSHMFLVSIYAPALFTRCLAHAQLAQSDFCHLKTPYQSPAVLK